MKPIENLEEKIWQFLDGEMDDVEAKNFMTLCQENKEIKDAFERSKLVHDFLLFEKVEAPKELLSETIVKIKASTYKRPLISPMAIIIPFILFIVIGFLLCGVLYQSDAILNSNVWADVNSFMRSPIFMASIAAIFFISLFELSDYKRQTTTQL